MIDGRIVNPSFFSRLPLIESIKDEEKTFKKKLTSMKYGGILINVADGG